MKGTKSKIFKEIMSNYVSRNELLNIIRTTGNGKIEIKNKIVKVNTY